MSRTIDFPEHLLTPQRLQLRGGRQLAWYEFGDPAGTPCLYTSGTPTSGTAGIFYHAAMRAAGIRWISLDKPGYGASDYQPGRRLLDWADDVSALADHLQLARFAVAGESGGGPHALALCHALPQRVSVGIVLSGLGPFQDASIRAGMHQTNRLMFWLAAHTAPLLWIPALAMRKTMRRTLDDPDHGWQDLQKKLAGMPVSDRAVYEDPKLRRLLVFAGYNALRHGPRAGVAEMKMLTQPWGFSLAEIKVPIHLWHGTADVNVPVAMGRYVASALPNCTSHIVEGAGHLMSLHHHAQIVAAIQSVPAK